MKVKALKDFGPFAIDGIGFEVINLKAGEHYEHDRAGRLVELGYAEEVTIGGTTEAVTADDFTDKLALDEWAEEMHEIKLKRNMSLPNMKIDFAKQYEAKRKENGLENKMQAGPQENK